MLLIWNYRELAITLKLQNVLPLTIKANKQGLSGISPWPFLGQYQLCLPRSDVELTAATMKTKEMWRRGVRQNITDVIEARNVSNFSINEPQAKKLNFYETTRRLIPEKSARHSFRGAFDRIQKFDSSSWA
jgi:hypothetical protein